jgi:hypothetical protein
MFPRLLLRSCLILILLGFGMSSASAHFNLNLNIRILHVEHLADGLRIYLRLPMPYLVANLLGEADGDGLPAPAPYTRNRMEDGVLLHYVDVEQLRISTDGLAQLAADGLVVDIEGAESAASIESFRLHPNGRQPDFATLDDARSAFESGQNFAFFEPEVYVGDATVDVMLRYHSPSTIYSYSLSSQLDPGLPDQDETANLVLDYSPGKVKVFRVRGLLHDPLVVTRSSFEAVLTFVVEGIKHILKGMDHVLFVVCLVLGALRFTPLLWRVTGFTVGHSVTLSLGFFGYVPDAAWFIPTIEMGIALSIIYVAAIAMVANRQAKQEPAVNEWSVVGVTASIGLLHGLGFSFVLHNILQVTSPNIWQSLLAFNIGVEIGQLMIVAGAWILFFLVARMGARVARLNRYLVAGLSTLVALYWVFERGQMALQSL